MCMVDQFATDSLYSLCNPTTSSISQLFNALELKNYGIRKIKASDVS